MSGYNRRQIGRVAFYAVALGAMLLDQITKAAARSYLSFDKKVGLVPGLVSMKLVENPGAAFGALGRWSPFLILVGIVAVLIIFGMRRERSKSRILAPSLGLLLGGTIGNLIDRLRFNGRVTDFIDFDVAINLKGRAFAWPTFNVADIALTFGVLLLIYHVFIVERRSTEENFSQESNNNN